MAVFRGAKRRHAKPFIAHQVQRWLREKNIKAIYIDPGSPWQNGFIESFHNRLRDECLNREVLLSVAEAQVLIEQWRQTYNNEHPHSRLGFQSPQEFVRFLSDLGRVRTLRPHCARPPLHINLKTITPLYLSDLNEYEIRGPINT